MRFCNSIISRFTGPSILMVACLLTACSTKSSQQTRATQAPQPTAQQPVKVDINEILPAGKGRELLMNNCTTCHTFVPIVVLQLNKEAWEHNKVIHRTRVPGLSDTDFNTLYTYLEANFNPDRPVPKLPQDLLDTWTTY